MPAALAKVMRVLPCNLMEAIVSTKTAKLLTGFGILEMAAAAPVKRQLTPTLKMACTG